MIRRDLVHRLFHVALVDEAESLLIDEARVPDLANALETPPYVALSTFRIARIIRSNS
jgi:preprotein translocase subunit SecA